MGKQSANQLLQSLISSVTAFFFLLLGLMSVLIAMIPGMRLAITQFIMADTFFLPFFGLTLTSMGGGLLIRVFHQLQRQTYQIKGGSYLTEVDAEVIQSYINEYWKELLPNHEISSHISIKENRVIIEADFPFMDSLEQKQILESVQKDLDENLNRFLGYRDEYLLTINFQQN